MAGCQAKRQASIEDACIQADIGRLVGKELGKEVGNTDGCQAKRQAGIEAGLYTYRHVHCTVWQAKN